MKRTTMLMIALALAACGSEMNEPSWEQAWDETAADEAFEFEEPVAVGRMLEIEDPAPHGDPCIDFDLCPDELDPVQPRSALSGSHPPGTRLLVLMYAPMRKSPSASAGTVGTVSPSNGGVSGGSHGAHPRGTIPPGQIVTMLYQPLTNNFYKVDYLGSRGWIHKAKLALYDDTIHPVRFARMSAHRDAYFLHQIGRTKWNKDGPSSSSNCAPTSLAMAAKIFGLDRPGRSPEQSIHAARRSYGASSNEKVGTFRWEIVKGAKNLGFDVQELGLGKTTSEEMDRIDKQLGWNRAIVLEGKPAQAYRDRMNAAYRAQGVSRLYTYAEGHSILVLSRLSNGKYVVGDPISEVGMLTMSRSELKAFFTRWGGTGTAVFIKGL